MGHSTTTAIQSIEKHIKSNKSNGKTSVIVATDLTAAYDVIDHSILLIKFEHVGLRGTPYKIIESYLCGRKKFIDIS